MSNLARTAENIDDESLLMLRQRYRASQWMRYVIRPLSLAILVLSLLTGVVALIRGVTLDQRWSALLIFLLLVALEAIYTTNWLRHPDRLRLDRTTYRAAELFLIVILVRIVSGIVFNEPFPRAADLRIYLGNPLAFFMNGPFIVSLLLTLITWRLAVVLSKIFSRLEVSEFELRYYSLPLAQRKAISEDQPIQGGRRKLVNSFAQYWVWGGILLAITVGLSSLEIRSFDFFKNPLAMGSLGLQPILLIMMLLYFGIGFWLLSQAKLMEMNARWLVNNITKDEQMERRWQRSTLLILFLIGLIAAFLPIGPTLAIGRILRALIYVLLFIINGIIFLLSIPVVLLLSLLSNKPIEEVEPLPPMIPEVPSYNPPAELSSLGEIVAMVFSSAFWSILAVVLVLALLFFLRERKNLSHIKSAAELWQQFKSWLQEFYWRFRLRFEAVRLQLPVRLARERKRDKKGEDRKRRWRFIRLSALAPREQIRYFYLSTVRRAGEKGVKRESAETPLEYAEDLKDGWPEVEEEVSELTEAFLEARYSDKEITSDDVPEVKETWKDVRRQLKKPSSPDQGDPPQ
jgi:hypothetical protein